MTKANYEKREWDPGALIILTSMSIPELIFLILGWGNKTYMRDYPLWALTLYLLLLFLMVCVQTGYINEKAKNLTWKNPLLYLIGVIIIVQVVLQFVNFKAGNNWNMGMIKTMQMLFVIPFGLYAIARKNFIAILFGTGMMVLVVFSNGNISTSLCGFAVELDKAIFAKPLNTVFYL